MWPFWLVDVNVGDWRNAEPPGRVTCTWRRNTTDPDFPALSSRNYDASPQLKSSFATPSRGHHILYRPLKLHAQINSGHSRHVASFEFSVFTPAEAPPVTASSTAVAAQLPTICSIQSVTASRLQPMTLLVVSQRQRIPLRHP